MKPLSCNQKHWTETSGRLCWLNAVMSPPSLLFLLVISQLLLDTVNKAYAVLVTVNLNLTEWVRAFVFFVSYQYTLQTLLLILLFRGPATKSYITDSQPWLRCFSTSALHVCRYTNTWLCYYIRVPALNDAYYASISRTDVGSKLGQWSHGGWGRGSNFERPHISRTTTVLLVMILQELKVFVCVFSWLKLTKIHRFQP